ncbi:hypothetical protein [Prochlorococcus marinus]|nr:hypothetical protein [Prochlorococcus marinus]
MSITWNIAYVPSRVLRSVVSQVPFLPFPWRNRRKMAFSTKLNLFMFFN